MFYGVIIKHLFPLWGKQKLHLTTCYSDVSTSCFMHIHEHFIYLGDSTLDWTFCIKHPRSSRGSVPTSYSLTSFDVTTI